MISRKSKLLITAFLLINFLLIANFSFGDGPGVPWCGEGWHYGCSSPGDDCTNYCFDMCEALPPDCDVMCCRNLGGPAECWYYCW